MATGVTEILGRLETGEIEHLPVVLAYVAGIGVVPEEEVDQVVVRARAQWPAADDQEPGLDDPAVKMVARDLHTSERRAALAERLDALAVDARDLPRVRGAVLELAADVDAAWRAYALAVLAEYDGLDDPEDGAPV